jgi:predicted  nucleic acid-binding Zn-ribbon protein
VLPDSDIHPNKVSKHVKYQTDLMETDSYGVYIFAIVGYATGENRSKGDIMNDKDAYVQKLHQKLDEWNAEIDKLKAKADRAEAESRVKYLKKIEDLEEKHITAEKKLAELREAGEGAWQDLKSGLQNAWDAMEEALTSARSRFN